MKTLHLGPEELLVAAKIAVVPRQHAAEDVAGAIDARRAGDPGRPSRPRRSIYLEPDIYRADYVPAERPDAARRPPVTEDGSAHLPATGVVEDSRERRSRGYA